MENITINKERFMNRVRRNVSSAIYDHGLVHEKGSHGEPFPLLEMLVANGEPIENGDDELEAIIALVVEQVEISFFNTKTKV